MSWLKGDEMSRDDLHLLHGAVKRTLLEAHRVRPKRVARSIVVLALSAAADAPQVWAADYTASNQAELQAAISAANADAVPSATIRLTASFAISPASLPVTTKPITIDSGSFTLTGASL